MTTSSTDADYDVVVVGGATGNNVAAAAADAGLETALVEKGPLGGPASTAGATPRRRSSSGRTSPGPPTRR